MAPNITQHYISRNCVFQNQMYPPLAFIVHRTAGHTNVEQLRQYWESTCVSSTFGISYDGYGYHPHDIWQYVRLTDGAGANCCPESGCHSFFLNRGNANTFTIPVEVCTPNTGNKGLMTNLQVEALVYLIQWTCNEMGIPTGNYAEYWNDYETAHTWVAMNGGIGMHRDVSPHNKQWCPGDPYYQGQMDEIIQQVKGGSSVTWLPPNKDKWVIDQHEALAKYLGKPAEIRDTGIFTQWRAQMLERNIVLGSPLGPEQVYDNDWMVQYFTAGAIFWNRHRVEYYTMSGSGEVSF